MVYDDTEKFLKGLDMKKHSLYLPGCSTDYLKTKWMPAGKDDYGHNVLVLASDNEMQLMSGQDIPLAVRIMAQVNEMCVLANTRNRVTLKIGNVPSEEWQEMKGSIESIIEEINKKNSKLDFANAAVDTPEKLTRLFKRCTLYILPQKHGALNLNIETLKAASIGLPILVPKTSSTACLLEKICNIAVASESVVKDHANPDSWILPVMTKLCKQDEAFQIAEEIRHCLILDITSAKTNMGFVKEILGMSHIFFIFFLTVSTIFFHCQ